jgi:hypothetical protein
MWTITIFSALVSALLYYSSSTETILENLIPIPKNVQPLPDTRYTSRALCFYHDQPHPPNRMPIFSPDRDYIWDGQQWIPNNGGEDRGFLFGVVLVILLVVAYQIFKNI